VADERKAKEGNVPHQIQDLVPDKFVGEAKAGLIDDPIFRQDDGIFEGPALSKSS
jgi:hypothetical protein